MARKTLANHLLKLSTYLLSLLLLVSLTIGSVYADSASKSDKTDMTIKDEIRTHMEMTGLQNPEIDKKLRQLEEKLSTGMSFKDSCTHCHIKQGGKP